MDYITDKKDSFKVIKVLKPPSLTNSSIGVSLYIELPVCAGPALEKLNNHQSR
jgi:hypothetical protein